MEALGLSGAEREALVTSIVGREPELLALSDLLADSRLITLLGSGGTGRALRLRRVLTRSHRIPARREVG